MRSFQHLVIVAALALVAVWELPAYTAGAADLQIGGSTVKMGAEPPGSSSADTAQAPSDQLPEFDYRTTRIALPGGTTVTPQYFYSKTLDGSMWYEVILPPGYEESSRQYPVLYMLHGVAGGASEWLEIGIHKAADNLWSEGAVSPFIIVLPDTGPSYYVNHYAGGTRWDDVLSTDLVEEIDAQFRTLPEPDSRAIGGLSMGGDGALRLALRHPDVFGVVGGHSPTTRVSYDQLPGTIFGDEEYWHENSALWLISNTPAASHLEIWLDMGEDDVWTPSVEALHEALLEADVPHQFQLLPGYHDGEYWIANQSDYIRFYASAFADAPSLVASGSPAHP